MAQKITRGYKKLIEDANKLINTIPTEEAIRKIDKKKYIFIDLRDYREIKREGKIPGSFSCPRGMLEFWIDPASPYHKEIFNKNSTYIFYCASAWRSALAVKSALDMGLFPVVQIEGGFNKWKKIGGPVDKI